MTPHSRCGKQCHRGFLQFDRGGEAQRHHVHLDPFDHGDFDEDDQLVMSNSWAITRKFANHEQAVSIINEYMRRLKETGDRFPWWSLQPGYPDELGYFKNADPGRRAQGNYANGGLFPWVGGEILPGSFFYGCFEAPDHFLQVIGCEISI